MNTAAKLSAHGAALALLVAGAWATGSAVGPLIAPTATAGEHGSAPGGTLAEAVADEPGGLASSRGGYTLTPTDPMLTAGSTATFSFTVAAPDGAPLTAFDVEHDKRMHLIVVRRDTTAFQPCTPRWLPTAPGRSR